MAISRGVFAFLFPGLSLTTLLFQFAPPPVTTPAPEILKTIDERTKQLGLALERLTKLNNPDSLLTDVEVFYKAVIWQLRHQEFYHDEKASKTLAVLDRGLLRASQLLRGDSPWLENTGFTVARGYRSQVDGSIQPYAVTFPADYLKNPNKKWRLDVVLHGRNPGLTEVAFLAGSITDKPVEKDLNHVRIDIYGRGNNAYRWAGETDVYEAVDNFFAMEQRLKRGQLIDPNRLVLRGFSMGGAGTWHLGLHRPDRWCVIGPGAGFTTTHGYVKDLAEKLPDYQEACLHIYDAVDYAENASMVGVVAYSGEKDEQKAAADHIEKRTRQLGIPITHLVAPGEKHNQPAEWVKKQEQEFLRFLDKGRPGDPREVRFTTFTLRYPTCEWVELIALEKHYARAEIIARYNDDFEYDVKTNNITALRFRMPKTATSEPVTVKIDKDILKVRPSGSPLTELNLYLEKSNGVWAAVLPEKLLTQRLRHPFKSSGLQGPIDDAFSGSFLCVRGSGEPWNPAIDAYSRSSLENFRKLWSKYLRGDLPIKDSEDVTPEDITSKHLILFGDPGSNPLIRQALSSLPLRWTKKSITWGEKDYSAGEHLPVLIYPSPFNSEHYMVLNSGLTFTAKDFEGTNALLFPRLGDYALLKIGGNKETTEATVINAGIFKDDWSR